MSDQYTQDQPFNAGPQFGLKGSAAEIESVLERVKDERLRLIRLLKDCETRFGTTGVVPPAEEIARLTGKVRAIDEAVRNRYTQLRHDESLVQKRAQQIDQIRECVQDLTNQVERQIAQAKNIKPDLAIARQSVQEETERVLDQARLQAAQIKQSLTDRLEEYRNAQSIGQEQLREVRREIEQSFKDIDNRLAAAAGMARDEAQKLIDPIFSQLENHATECGRRIQEMAGAVDDVLRDKLEELPAKAQQVLAPTRESLESVIEDARDEMTSINDALRSLDQSVQELSGKAQVVINQNIEEMAGRIDQAIDARLAEKIEQQQEAIDRQQAAFNDHLRKQDEQFTQYMLSREKMLHQGEQEVTDKIAGIMMDKQAEIIVMLDDQMSSQADRLLAQQQDKIDKILNDRVDAACAKLTRRLEESIDGAEEKAEQTAQQIKERLVASIDQSRAEAEAAISQLIEQVTQEKDRVNHSMTSHRDTVTAAINEIEQKAREVSEKSQRQAEDVGHMIESKLREQVIGAMSRADALSDPLKARLDESLDEVRSKADEYIQQAEAEQSEKAKAHWDAFRQTTKAALEKQKNDLDVQAQATVDQSQEKMRQRVQELCSSSQSMVDMVEQQLVRRLKGIEPQSTQILETIEKQIHGRLSQLRQNAEAMVQLVEDQLSKRVSELQPSAINAARDAERELNEHMDRIRQEVEAVVGPLRRQVIEELSQIADVGKTIRGVIKHDGAHHTTNAGTTEPPIVDARRLMTPLQEMAARMNKKAAQLVNTNVESSDTAEADDSDDEADRKAA